MLKRIKSNELPSWFDLSRYEKAAEFDLVDWHLNLVPRFVFSNLKGKEIIKYRTSFEECFSGEEGPLIVNHVIGDIRKWLIAARNEDSKEKFTECNLESDSPHSRLIQATIQLLPVDYIACAIAQAKYEESDLSAALILASEKFWKDVSTDGDLEVDDEVDALLREAIDLLVRKSSDLRDDPFLHVEVNMHAPDSLIIDDFRKWLIAAREVFEIPAKNLFTESDMDSWAKFQILPFVDLSNWAKLEDVKIPDPVMGAALFPNEYDVSLSERIAKVVRPKANWLTRSSVVNAIQAQTDNME